MFFSGQPGLSEYLCSTGVLIELYNDINKIPGNSLASIHMLPPHHKCHKDYRKKGGLKIPWSLTPCPNSL